MKLTVHRRNFRLRQPFHTSGWSMESREVLLLHLISDDGKHAGWGECAPLPVFGTESLDPAVDLLSAAAELFASCSLPYSACLGVLDDALPELQRSPATRFALDSALLDLEARSLGASLSDLLGGKQRSSIPLNAVTGGGSAEDAAKAAVLAEQQGFRCLKMKVGAEDLDHDLTRVRAVRAAVAPTMALRLDANGTWDFGEAEEALHALRPYKIEYVEQPVPATDVDELAALTGLNILPIAADEAVHDIESIRALLARHAANIIVIKPMVLGGLQRAREGALLAYEQGVDVVFTSLIDSSLARHAVAQLCASLPGQLRPQGLATGMLYAEDCGRDRIEQGAFVLPDESGIGIIPDVEEA